MTNRKKRILQMPHYGHDLANKNYKRIIQNIWDKLNELIDIVNYNIEKLNLDEPSETQCDSCNATGKTFFAENGKCPHCSGTGKIPQRDK